MFERIGKTLARILVAASFVMVLGAASVTVEAQYRIVIVNGQLLSPQDLYVLDQMNSGYVPNGSYWLDPQSGVWGYAGDPTPRGRLGGGAAGGGGGAPNYYGALDRCPIGNNKSDGNCSFVNGVPVGNC